MLNQKKDKVLNEWFDRVINTYPEDTAKFFGRKKDAFANPVGNILFKGLKAVLEELLGGMNPDALRSFLDPVVRIRAVQGLSPSEALSFVFSLKSIVRTLAAKESKAGQNVAEELLAFELKIDRLSLISFDTYCTCREKIFELKANEVKNRTFRAFKRANLVTEE